MNLLVPTAALIVDDEAHVRTYVKLLLRPFGVETFYEAANVDEARVLWARHRPGLVMLDVTMPGESGLVFLYEVRKDDQEAYVVILSADAHSATLRDAIAYGADGFIRKDQSAEQIGKALEGIFEQKEV